MPQHASDARCHWVKNPLVHAGNHMHVTQRVHDVESRISHLACERAFTQKVCGSGVCRAHPQAVFETGACWGHRGRGKLRNYGATGAAPFEQLQMAHP